MASRFENSWSRAQRAAHHLIAFNSEWERVFADHGMTAVFRDDEDSGWFIASMVIPVSTSERFERNSLALELGEYAYQLRSALDGLIWDAITFAQGAEPPSDANRVEFPAISGTSRKFEDCAFLKYPFPKKLADWIESIQPNAAEKPEGDPDRGLSTAIGDIHDLARFDRHRRLRVIGAVPTTLRFGIAAEPPARIIARERIDPCDLFSGQHEFLRFKIETVDGAVWRHMALKTELAFEVLFEDIQPFPGMDGGTQLGTYIGAVEHIIRRFEDEFR